MLNIQSEEISLLIDRTYRCCRSEIYANAQSALKEQRGTPLFDPPSTCPSDEEDDAILKFRRQK